MVLTYVVYTQHFFREVAIEGVSLALLARQLGGIYFGFLLLFLFVLLLLKFFFQGCDCILIVKITELKIAMANPV